jgi:hypothetical protein
VTQTFHKLLTSAKESSPVFGIWKLVVVMNVVELWKASQALFLEAHAECCVERRRVEDREISRGNAQVIGRSADCSTAFNNISALSPIQIHGRGTDPHVLGSSFS